MGRSADRVVEQITAGVDWITLTMPGTSSKEMVWYTAGLHRLNMIRAQGYELKQRHMLGYYGYSCGNCFLGERADGIMMQFTGHHADAAFGHIYRKDAHISRIDLQVTVKYEVMPMGIAKEAYVTANTANRNLPAARRRKLYVIVGSDGGDTLYIGSPSSEQRGRLYNKEIQSEEPSYVRTWRYECVFRNDRASSVAAAIRGGTNGVAAKVRDLVCSWWRSRGVDCTDIESGRELVIPLLRTLPTDIEAKLKWLRTQVRPTVKLLLELGMNEELYEALNLPIARPDEVS